MWRACICKHFTFENAHTPCSNSIGAYKVPLFTLLQNVKGFMSTNIIQPTMFLNLNKKSGTTIHQRCYYVCYDNHNEIK
jgi:hypothetical protein